MGYVFSPFIDLVLYWLSDKNLLLYLCIQIVLWPQVVVPESHLLLRGRKYLLWRCLPLLAVARIIRLHHRYSQILKLACDAIILLLVS